MSQPISVQDIVIMHSWLIELTLLVWNNVKNSPMAACLQI